MKVPKKVVETVDVKYVRFHAKMRDEGTYILLNNDFAEIKEKEGYVPSIFPYGKEGTDNHFGDYVDLIIDIETGQIANWKKKITPEEVARDFGLLEEEED